MAYPVTNAALRFSNPALIATVRALAGGLIMLPVLRALGARLPSTAREWAWAAAIGAGNVTLTLIGISEGTRLTGAAAASVLVNSAPFFAALMGRIALAERITGLRATGLVVGFAGIVLIVAGGHHGSHGSNVAAGVVVCLVGALGWAAAGLGMRYLSLRRPGFNVYSATTAQFFCGGILLLPYLIGSDGLHGVRWSAPELWTSMAFLVIGGQVLTYVLFYVALSRWPSARVFAWTFIAPAVAVLVEGVLGQLPAALSLIGILLVIGGVGVVNHPRAEAAADPRSG